MTTIDWPAVLRAVQHRLAARSDPHDISLCVLTIHVCSAAADELERQRVTAQEPPPPAPIADTDGLDGAEEMLRRIAASAGLYLDATEAAAIVAELDRLRGAAKKAQPRDKDEEQS